MSHRSWLSRGFALIGAAVLGLVLAGAPEAPRAQVFISGTSPNPVDDPNDPLKVTACNGAPQLGIVYRNSESEPHLAVNPANPANMIAGWHQDRWSTGAAQSLGAAYTLDGGATWTQVRIPFTRCSGATSGSVGDYERASDPWISFSSTGIAHYMALVENTATSDGAMLTARSIDGGVTWSAPVAIARHKSQDQTLASLFHDKNTITADPFDPNLVYATWTLFRSGFSSVLFSRSSDGGQTWSPAIPIATMGNGGSAERTVFRQAAQIVVLPNRTLVNGFYRRIFDSSTGTARFEQAVLRSTDQGKHWSRLDTPVASFASVTAIDPELGVPVRDAQELPILAVNPSTGQLYMTWQDGNANNDPRPRDRPGVVVARSNDGGLTWSAPVRVNQGTGANVQAFLPSVTVSADGTVGVLFYDFRNDVLGDAQLSTDVWLSLFDADLNYIKDYRLTRQSFDMRQMVITGDRGYFPGDYVGLSSMSTTFVAAFTIANDLGLRVDYPQNNNGLFVDNHDRQSIVFVKQIP